MGMAGGRRVHRESTTGKKGAAGEDEATGSNPTDRGKAGSKRHLLTDAKGIPLAVVLSGANRHDSKKLAVVLDAVMVERPKRTQAPAEAYAGDKEQHLCLDRGYNTLNCRDTAQKRFYTLHVPDKGEPIPAPADPARRWVVEVTHAWFNRFRRLQTRWEKKASHYLGFVQLAACLIIWRKLAPLSG